MTSILSPRSLHILECHRDASFTPEGANEVATSSEHEQVAIAIGSASHPEVIAIGSASQPEVIAIGSASQPEVIAIGSATQPEVIAIGSASQPEVIEQHSITNTSATQAQDPHSADSLRVPAAECERAQLPMYTAEDSKGNLSMQVLDIPLS